jgi:hypothetical protein
VQEASGVFGDTGCLEREQLLAGGRFFVKRTKRRGKKTGLAMCDDSLGF